MARQKKTQDSQSKSQDCQNKKCSKSIDIEDYLLKTSLPKGRRVFYEAKIEALDLFDEKKQDLADVDGILTMFDVTEYITEELELLSGERVNLLSLIDELKEDDVLFVKSLPHLSYSIASAIGLLNKLKEKGVTVFCLLYSLWFKPKGESHSSDMLSMLEMATQLNKDFLVASRIQGIKLAKKEKKLGRKSSQPESVLKKVDWCISAKYKNHLNFRLMTYARIAGFCDVTLNIVLYRSNQTLKGRIPIYEHTQEEDLRLEKEFNDMLKGVYSGLGEGSACIKVAQVDN